MVVFLGMRGGSRVRGDVRGTLWGGDRRGV